MGTKIFNHFRSAFREFKQKLPNYFNGEMKPKTWEFQEHLIFKRYDSFVDRLGIIREFFQGPIDTTKTFWHEMFDGAKF